MSEMNNAEKLRSLNAMRKHKKDARKAAKVLGHSRMICDLDLAKDIMGRMPDIDKNIIAGYMHRAEQMVEIRKKTKLADLAVVWANLLKCEREIFAKTRMEMRANGDWHLNMFLFELVDIMRALMRYLFTPPSWYRQ